MQIRTTTTILAILISLTNGYGAPVKQDPAIITVDPFINHVVNGVGALQSMNGLAVNGSSGMEQVNETRELMPSTFKLFLYVKPLKLHWKVVRDMMKTRQGNEELQAMLAKVDMDKVVADWFDSAMGIDPATGRRIPGTRYSEQFQQLEQLQAWNARSNIVLFIAQPHPIRQENFPVYARYFNACVREVKQRFPDLGPLYLMVFNEPDYEYPNKRAWDDKGISESVHFFYEFYNALDVALRKAHPEVTLIGPGISGFMSWRNWQNWTLPYLEQVPQADFFNVQPYCRRFSDLAAWSEMLQAESLRINGKRVPLVMTEANFGGMRSPGTEWWRDELHVQRVFDESRAMLGLMNQPDQFAMKHYFIYHYNHEFADMWYEQNGKVKNTPVYHLYWLLRDLKGDKCLSVLNREASPLRTIAAKNGTTVTLAVFNQSMEPASATLEMRWPDGILAPPCVVEYVRYNADSKAFEHGVEPRNHYPQTLAFAPGEVKKLRWVYSPTRDVPMEPMEETTFYSEATAVVVRNAAQSISLNARAVGAEETVRLRLAIYLDDLLAADRISWRFNDHEMEARFSPAPYDEGRVNPIITVDCAVPAAWIDAANTLSFMPLSDSAYRVMFAALVVRPQPRTFPLFQPSNAFLKGASPVGLSLSVPRYIEPGEHAVLIALTNNTQTVKKGTVTLDLPDGWSVEGLPDSVTLEARSSQTIAAMLNAPQGRMRSEAFVSATLAVPGQADTTVRRGTAYQVPFQAEYAEQAPIMDGELGEWTAASFIEEEHRGPGITSPFLSRFAAQWDETHLYLAVEVDGRSLDDLPADTPDWWHHDTLELFLDFWNEKKTERDHRTMQVWIALHALAQQGPQWGTLPTDPNASAIKGTSPSTFTVKVVKREDGFSMEAALDWESLSSGWEGSADRFTPSSGAVVGCEVTLAGRSLIGSRIKHWATPAKWGNLTLLKSGDRVTRPPQTIILDTSMKKPTEGEGGKAAPPRFQFSQTATEGWSFPAKALMDAAGLHLSNNHSTLLLEAPVQGGLGENGVEVDITLSGFERTGDREKPLISHARIFLAPDEENSNEPYTMKEMFCLLVDYREHGDVVVTLYQKVAPARNWGNALWSGALALDAFPVRLSLRLDAGNYRIRCDKTLQPIGGSLSGKHAVLGPSWSGPLRFGVKSCFASRPGAVIIKNIEIH